MFNFTTQEIKKQLQLKVAETVRYLLPNGTRSGNEWVVGGINDGAGKSMKVRLTGDKAGVWSDFATGETGDIINLWCVTRKVSFADAMISIRRYLGIAAPLNAIPNKYIRPQKIDCAQMQSTAVEYLVNERKLTLETIAKYRILSDHQNIFFPYYQNNELIMIKYLALTRGLDGKKSMKVSANSQPCLFGWQAVSGDVRTAVIVEGEIDAMTLYQYEIPYVVLSVPLGGGSGDKQKWIAYEFDRLAHFDEIFLCLDNDNSGKEAANEIADRLGIHRCRIVKLPHKDANECLQHGISSAEIMDCFAVATSLDPAELKFVPNFRSETKEVFSPPNGIVPGYRLYQLGNASDKILFRPHELSVWTGTNGHGKTQFLGQAMLDFIEQGAKVCIASLEIRPARVLHDLIQQAAALEKPTEGYIDAIIDWYAEKLSMFDLVGTAKTERLLQVFDYAVRKYAIDVFLIDSFLKCGVREDDYSAQKEFIEQLSDFVNKHNCHIHLIVHPRKGEDETRVPGKMDIRGTGSVTDLAHNCFCIWRNKNKEEAIAKLVGTKEPVPIELLSKIDGFLRCDKQRHGKWEGRIGFWYDVDTHRYVGRYDQKPKSLVDYSNIPSCTAKSDEKQLFTHLVGNSVDNITIFPG